MQTCGLVPALRHSGKRTPLRAGLHPMGNARLRRGLYMATLSATQHHPAIRAFYRRLRAAGKPPKVARCAAARKLLHQAWALGSKLRHFDPHHGQQHQEASPGLAA